MQSESKIHTSRLSQAGSLPSADVRHLVPDGPEEEDDLKDAATDEEEYVKDILRKELGREPTPKDIDDWIRQQTESF